MNKYKLQSMVIELTGRCNLKCKHCGSDCGEAVRGNELSTEEWKTILSDARALGADKVVFAGGEPTLRPDLAELASYAAELGIRYGIISNGWNVRDELFEALSHRHKHLFGFGVSIDGMKKEHDASRGKDGCWEQALHTLGEANGRWFFPTVAITTLTRENMHCLAELRQTLVKYWVKRWQIQLAIPMGRMCKQGDLLLNEEEVALVAAEIARLRALGKIEISAADCFGLTPAGVLRQYDWPGCGAGLGVLGILSDGGVLPCLSLQMTNPIASLREKPLAEIWQDNKLFFNRKFKPAKAAQKCQVCPDLATCRGGCASLSMATAGKFHHSPVCLREHFNEKNGSPVLMTMPQPAKKQSVDSTPSPPKVDEFDCGCSSDTDWDDEGADYMYGLPD